MKIKFLIALLIIVFLVGYGDIKNNQKGDENIVADDDLLYRDYGTSIRLSKDSELNVDKLDLNINKDETAKLYIIDLENKSIKKTYDNYYGQYISYDVDEDGVYSVIAVISNGTKIDLTTKAIIRTNTMNNSSGVEKL